MLFEADKHRSRLRVLIEARWLIVGALLTAMPAISGCGGPEVERADNAVGLDVSALDPLEETPQKSHWPGYRGANVSGVSADKRLAVSFSGDQGLRWKTAVPGRGNSSPVVWDDNIFLTSAIESNGHDGAALAVLCFDRKTGDLRWRKDVATAAGSTHNKNGHASASATTDGERIYASFGAAGLFALDFGGNRLWRAPLGKLEHEWGTASSPVLYGDLVIQLCDSASGSSIAAFRAATGKPAWRIERESSGSWSTPVFVQAPSRDTDTADGGLRTEMIVNGTGGTSGGGWVIAYDPTTGRELWRVKGTTDAPCPSAIIGAGLAISTSGRDGPTIAIRPGGDGDVTKTHVAWKQRRGAAYVPTGVAYRNRLYAVSDAGAVACTDLGDGRTVWKSRLRGGSVTSSLIAGDGRIYATTEKGGVFVLAAGDEFELLASNKLGEDCYATPAVADGELLFRTTSSLLCVARGTGEVDAAVAEAAMREHEADDPSPSDLKPTSPPPMRSGTLLMP